MRVVLRVACVLVSVTFATWYAYLTVCSITYWLLMMDYLSVSLFYISVLSPYFAHFVAHFIISRVV